jgi:myo-inositol-1-phosphate synthase
MINIGILGLGNCAKSLVEGVIYYTKNKTNIDGIMRSEIGNYYPKDINFVAAFEIDSRKIDKTIGEALLEKPNCAINLISNEELKQGATCIVSKAPVLDGYSEHLDNYPESNRFLVSEDLRNTTDINRTSLSASEIKIWKKELQEILINKKVDILINYLPVGSQAATEFWAEICLETGISLLNCIPVFIASNPIWEERFIKAGIPIIGDDMKSQFGASILSQMLQELAFERGHHVKCHIQRNIGGNTDFLNMENKKRLKSKKISKENVISCQNTIRNISLNNTFLHAGPSEYISYYGDNKVANFRLELEGFGKSPVILDAQLSVQDSPNSAGVVIDAIRYLKVARELGIVVSLRGLSAFTQKTPPQQMMFSDALQECEALANRKLTNITKQQVQARAK